MRVLHRLLGFLVLHAIVTDFRWLSEMQTLRAASEADARECESLRTALQKQEEQQTRQQQQFAELLEALQQENGELRMQQVVYAYSI